MASDMNRSLREQLPEEYKKCRILNHVTCNCFPLVADEASMSIFLSVAFVVVLVTLLALTIYALTIQQNSKAVLWALLGLDIASLVIFTLSELNKRSAVHKIRYKRERDKKSWWEPI